jgi:hypothetical protein
MKDLLQLQVSSFMIIPVAAGRELGAAELARVGFFTGVPSHVHFEVALFKESETTILTLVVRYLIEMGVPLMKSESRVPRV